ncbi:caspase-6-like isoform X2 [Apostichopus japonicus]
MAETDNNSQIQFDIGYDMEHYQRGYALIFNNTSFTSGPPRYGSYKDKEGLKATFDRLRFVVDVFDDYTSKDIKDTLINASRKDHSGYDCFLCVFLTHGDAGIIYGSDNSAVRLKEDVFNIFKGNNCSSLIGKPKIFIIQACRGSMRDTSVLVGGGAQAKNVCQEEGVEVITIPTEADFLISYSSSEGFVSYREHENGSWFIQELTRVLNEFGNSKDFIQILTVVNKLVSERTIDLSQSPNLAGKKQMPCFLSRLTKKLCFTDYVFVY